MLTKLNLSEYKKAHPHSLSGGQKQRLAIATSLMQKKHILCMDEPTSGLDYENMTNVANILDEESNYKCVLIATHDYEFVTKICNSVICMTNSGLEKIEVTQENKEKILDKMNLRSWIND